MADSFGRNRWWEIPAVIACAVALVVVVVAFFVQPFAIPSGSMQPLLEVGDRVLVDKTAYRDAAVARGDVVVFDGRDSFVAAGAASGNAVTELAARVGRLLGFGATRDVDFVKRVVGIGGDRVTCCDDAGRLSVNGRPIDESDYLFPGDDASEQSFDVVVPTGRLWLMGDHRSQSADSRDHLGDPGGGMVSVNAVTGRVSMVLWPFSRLGAVEPTSVFAGTPEGTDG